MGTLLRKSVILFVGAILLTCLLTAGFTLSGVAHAAYTPNVQTSVPGMWGTPIDPYGPYTSVPAPSGDSLEFSCSQTVYEVEVNGFDTSGNPKPIEVDQNLTANGLQPVSLPWNDGSSWGPPSLTVSYLLASGWQRRTLYQETANGVYSVMCAPETW